MKKREKYETEGASLNINKGRFGRKRTVRTEKAIEFVRLYLKNYARSVSCRHNGLGLSRSNFKKIVMQGIKQYTYKIATRHELCNPD